MIKATKGNDVKKAVQEICKKRLVNDIYFVACGGSLSSLYSTYYLIRNESENVNSIHMTANEFVHATPKNVNKNAVVITYTLSGTPETIEAAKVAKKLGAISITISNNENSPIFKYGDYKWIEGSEKSDVADADGKVDVTTTAEALVLRFGFEILKIRDNYKDYAKAIRGFEVIDYICKRAERMARPLALKFAKENEHEDTIYTMASGSLMGKAYALSICMFMEMLWMHSFAIHNDEFFNGPFEMVERNTSFVIFMSAGKTRKLDERALKFLQRHTDKITIIDLREFGVSMIDNEVEEYFAPLVADCMYDYATALSVFKCHPIPERRYMHRFEY